MIPGDSGFWPLLKDWTQLKHLLGGNSDVDVDALLENAEWSAWWEDEDKAVFAQVLQELRTEGQGKPAPERVLNQLLRFFTGSFKEPVEGWKKTKVHFQARHPTDHPSKCRPLEGHTCFNELIISKGCLKDAKTLKQIISESLLSTRLGIANRAGRQWL